MRLFGERSVLLPGVIQGVSGKAVRAGQSASAGIATNTLAPLAANQQARIRPDPVRQRISIIGPVLINDTTMRPAGQVRAGPMQDQAVMNADTARALNHVHDLVLVIFQLLFGYQIQPRIRVCGCDLHAHIPRRLPACTLQ